ncbi:kinase-like protein [Trematosphaeria pertusa]|uniref:Kinase-like protein n=1 Tax=Trematosphaeria pertusa TaxID=390896 RepID=A0A6A6HRS2_9PLEO|nr:kinase-like protein [Trematosphaeria pertusa]KAF2240508.1 kinase-like protein [Trematosphaeria pertusa]
MEGATSTTTITQPGLQWDYEELFFGPQPKWTVEPNIDVIRSIVKCELALAEDAQCEVKFLAEGSINKVYTVKCADEKTYIMRVALPVHPRLRTLSEIATIEFIRENADIPLPEVIQHDASFTNELGFEWMIMNLVPGASLETQWHKISWLKKELLVRKVITYLTQLFNKRFDGIGSLYIKKDLVEPTEKGKPSTLPIGETKYCLGETVSLPFFLGDHLTQSVSRGPFKSSREWLAARLQLYISDSDKILSDSSIPEDDYDHISATCVKQLAIKLMAILPKVFPENTQEDFILHNHDLNTPNILVDAEGELTGIIDWECIHTSPLWFACQLPEFLCGPRRHELPMQSEYMCPNDETGEEELDEQYWDHMEEYEKTCLRQFFFEEMQRVLPEWVNALRESEVKADFELAMQYLDNELLYQQISGWIEEVEQGKTSRSLKDSFRG